MFDLRHVQNLALELLISSTKAPDPVYCVHGDVLISPVADRESLARMGLDPNRSINVGRFGDGQKRYLEFHRENVLLRSRFLEERRG